jgi:DNA-binding CsgD family transcriptional regulator
VSSGPPLLLAVAATRRPDPSTGAGAMNDLSAAELFAGAELPGAALPPGSGFVEQILCGVPLAVLVLDDRQRVLFANCAAATLLTTCGDLRLAGQHLAAAQPPDQKRLEPFLSQAAAAAGSSYLRLGRNQRSQVWLQARAIAGQGGAGAYLLLIVGHARAGLDSRHHALRQLFGMSKSEADIAIDLALGETAAQIARKRMVSVHTVRTQIRSVLLKSGSERIVDLIRIVASAPGPDVRDGCACGEDGAHA